MSVVDLPPELPPPDLPPEAPAAKVVQMAVGNTGNLGAADTRLRALIMAKGHMVRLVSDTAAVNVMGVDLVVLSATCDSADLAARYRDVTVPVVNLESAIMDDMGMTGATEGTHFQTAETNQINIINAAHPMAAGLPMGPVTVLTGGNQPLTWGVPEAAAENVATLTGMVMRATIFGYPKGAMMLGRVAPARRVGFFAAADAPPTMNDNAVKLFGAALDWALLP